MDGHNDPRLLFSIPGIKAYHIQHGQEDSLTPSGPQTLSLLMVPTSSPFADVSAARAQNESPEEDFYLHLNLPPELDLPLPATTQIYHQPPNSYLIPRWDLGPESGAFTRIEFPPLGQGVTQEDVDTFETILAQCTAFLERAQGPPPHYEGTGFGGKSYNPGNFKPGEAYVHGTGKSPHGQVVLIDEDDGHVVGELAEGAEIEEDPALKPGSKTPVEIQISPDGQHVDVRPISEEYLRMARHPAYQNSTLVQNAAAASRLIVTGSSYISNMMTSGAEGFMQKTKPNNQPVTFQPATHQRVRKIHDFTSGAASLSAKTVGQATKYAQNLGASITGRSRKEKGADYKPGILNKSMIAFSTVVDGIEASGRSLLQSGSAAATAVVGHKYGEDAGRLTADLAGGVKNVGLVYIDVAGVSRRAVLKSVAKGMVVGRVKGGGEVVVGGGDGGDIPPDVKDKAGVSNDNLGQGQPGGGSAEPGGVVGFGNALPQNGSSGIGEPLGGQSLQGQYVNEKR
ncbi:senescence-associated protein-domain-containing protein [Phyllosticta capitalensis]